MRKFLVVVLFTTGLSAQAQKSIDINKIITVADVTRIEKTLASDDMEGRKAFTPGIEKAADFIAGEFQKIGLTYFKDLKSYRQSFNVYKSTPVSSEGTLNGQTADFKKIIAVSTDEELVVNNFTDYKVQLLDTGISLLRVARDIVNSKQKSIIVVPEFYSKQFSRLNGFNRNSLTKYVPVIFILADKIPTEINITFKHKIDESPLSNMVAVLPGKTKPEEIVVFSAHYDHLGIGKPNAAMDSIYNGANDDAAGTAAVISLAKYFKALNNNQRTIIFTAFTAEEIGGYGSSYFSKQVDPEKIVAMFNIEMIGTESKWGKNSAYITGFEKSDFGQILQKNLAGSKFKFEPDPYPQQNLFYRSDNATLAALGVPAHTISTSKMDSEPYYHSQEDEIETLDLENMTEIIKAIATSSTGIIEGKQTPTRVEKLN